MCIFIHKYQQNTNNFLLNKNILFFNIQGFDENISILISELLNSFEYFKSFYLHIGFAIKV